MGSVRIACWRATTLTLRALIAAIAFAWPAYGQAVVGRFELSEAVQVDVADSSTRTHLERIKELIATSQWDEAVETLRMVGESHGQKVVSITPHRFLGVREYCHLMVTRLPAEGLALYRSRVDPQARAWYEEGVRLRNADRLEDVVEQLFASSWGDDALYALGEMALERGDYGQARGYWERILPPSHWLKVSPPEMQSEGTPDWLVYPDTDLDVSHVLARLVVVRIMEGDVEGARHGLLAFEQEFARSEGRLGGKVVNFREALASLIDQSREWPRRAPTVDWPTFGGSPMRSRLIAGPVEPAVLRWRVPLGKAPAADVLPSLSVAEDNKGHLLSYHPVIVDGRVLVCGLDPEGVPIVLAYDLASGRPAWGDDPVIFRDANGKVEPARGSRNRLGPARFTLTALGGKLYARLGNPVTSSPSEQTNRSAPGFLVCLDLASQGAMLWRVVPEEGWAFEGSPVSDGTNVYVALRKSDVPPQANVACLDAQTGRTRWRRFVCSADTPAQGQYEEITHNLLTLDRGVLYFNTNLGAVAALSTRDGHIPWIYLYQRAKERELGQRGKHFYRNLTPCVCDSGTLYVAPSDSEHILALNASTGLLAWYTDLAEDVVHLLGVSGGHLLASGDKLWWIDKHNGKVVHPPWPDGPTPKGFGRGALAGGRVYWPTRTAIHVFDQETGRQEQQPLELSTHTTTGGNLVASGKWLLIATSGPPDNDDPRDELVAFGPADRPPETPPETLPDTVEVTQD